MNSEEARAEIVAAQAKGHFADLRGADLRGADLRGEKLVYADLSGANLLGADLSGADLVYSKLVRANLTGANLTDAKLSHSYMFGAVLARAVLSRAQLQSADLSRAVLTDADLVGAVLRNANMLGADLEGATLVGADAESADLSDASLLRADLTGADLTYARLSRTILTGANLTDVDFTGANLNDFVGYPLVWPDGFVPPPSRILQEEFKVHVPTSPEFRAWFGNSRAVDTSGAPVLLYHGTYKGGFTAFDPAKADPHHPGFYFTNDISNANTYLGSISDLPDPTPSLDGTHPASSGGAYRVWARMENPFVFDAHGAKWDDLKVPEYPVLRRTYEVAHAAKRDGYDGVIFRNLRDNGGMSNYDEPSDVYVVFSPTQIKSALFNDGSFSRTDPDIRKNPRRRTSRSPRRLRRNPDVIEKTIDELTPAESEDLFALVQQAYAHVGGHGNLQSVDDLWNYRYALMADTDGDGHPNVAILAGKVRNGSTKVGVFATDGSQAAKQVLMTQIKTVLSRPDWWAELPSELASFLRSRGAPMIEDQMVAIMLLGRRVNHNEFAWLGKISRHVGEGYFSRSYFGSEPDVRAIVGNVTPELIEKIQQFVASEHMGKNPRRRTSRGPARKTSRRRS